MNSDTVPPPLPPHGTTSIPMRKNRRAKSPITVLAMAFLVIVIWNVLWYFSVHGYLSARFKSSALPCRETEPMVRTYLFPKSIAFDGAATNSSMRPSDGRPTVTRLRSVGYDPMNVLGEAYYYFRSSESDCDVEITVEVSDQTLSMDFKPRWGRADPPESVSESWLSSPYVNHKTKTYRIGEDCIRCDDNTFAFRYVTTSGGYGLGLEITEVVSAISFETDSLHYDISRNAYGLGMWVIPCVDEWDDTHLILQAIETTPITPAALDPLREGAQSALHTAPLREGGGAKRRGEYSERRMGRSKGDARNTPPAPVGHSPSRRGAQASSFGIQRTPSTPKDCPNS